MSKEVPPAVVMTFLNDLYTRFDRWGLCRGSRASWSRCDLQCEAVGVGRLAFRSWHAQPAWLSARVLGSSSWTSRARAASPIYAHNGNGSSAPPPLHPRSLTDVYGVYKVETIGDCYMVG